MNENTKLKKGPLNTEPNIDLMKKFDHASKISYELNTTNPLDKEKINNLLKELIGKLGENAVIMPPFYCNIGSNIHIGKGTFININNVFLDTDTIEIGEVCLLGPGVNIFAATHPTSTKERVLPVDDLLEDENYSYIDSNGNFDKSIEYTFTNYQKPVKIGDRCWIGANSIILPGVTIGDNVVIGAGSVVTKDIPSNVIAAGIPAKIIKENK
ncbi:MAG: sugar O-acetyltransferase [Methanobacteriaceae archaeon]|nr:sugar O-acetyltransferase [Methanobacteriaceae archaeon]